MGFPLVAQVFNFDLVLQCGASPSYSSQLLSKRDFVDTILVEVSDSSFLLKSTTTLRIGPSVSDPQVDWLTGCIVLASLLVLLARFDEATRST